PLLDLIKKLPTKPILFDISFEIFNQIKSEFDHNSRPYTIISPIQDNFVMDAEFSQTMDNIKNDAFEFYCKMTIEEMDELRHSDKFQYANKDSVLQNKYNLTYEEIEKLQKDIFNDQ
ncbi:16158_t:CDS:2, partial [Cetraspora pellucida]